jgi:hypothetical protein
MSFYNTISLNGKELQEANKKADSQEKIVYELMKGGGEWTATRINEVFPRWIKTSIRRCLTDLSNDDKIERIDQVPSPNGSKEGLYRVRKQVKLF